jgi:hypothetical protein
MSIFISIASYCDPLLGFTLSSAYKHAKQPEQLRFGVVDQSPVENGYPVPADIPVSQVSYVKVDATQSRGCCWARSLTMSLYQDEDYYFQVDSHTMFTQDWDEILVRKLQACLHFSEFAVISSYPPAFRFVNGVATADIAASENARTLSAAVVNPGATFDPTHPCLSFRTKKIMDVGAVQGYHVSAGCLFAPGKFVACVPYDPFLYFGEEEQNISLRLYTHGWDIYHVPGIPVYHLYNEPPEKSGVQERRPLHWDPVENSEKPVWWSLVDRAKRRISTLLWGDSAELGQYGLGDKRSLQAYALMCGIDYPNRSIAQKATEGPWSLGGGKTISAAPKPQRSVAPVDPQKNNL